MLVIPYASSLLHLSFRRGSIGEYDGCRLRSLGYASTSSAPFSATDPTLDQAHDLIEQGTKELEEGNLDGAKKYYEQSVNVKETSGAWFNLGVCPCSRPPLHSYPTPKGPRRSSRILMHRRIDELRVGRS